METKLYGRNIYFVGAHDESAVRAIQGSTLAFAYVDEITAIPAPFWKMLIGRLSIAGARLAGTCNPDGPYHWFKKEFIDRCADLDMVVWNFNLDDNPVLDPVYKENLKKEYTGMWYKRYILGEWAVAHGLIYDGFDQDNLYEHPFDNPIYYICGIDYGCSNPTAAIVCSVNPHKWPQIRTEDIYHYDSIKKGKSLTTDELADNIYQMLKYKNVRSVYVDPSAADLKLELRNRNLPVLDANNDVLEGIKVVSKFIARKNIVIQKGHTELIECLQTYSWDEKAANRGEDKPLKKNDHLADALRYAIYSEFPTGEIDRTGENMTIEQIREYVYGDDKINLYGSGPFG
jgi:PBSX family phage terminase large subunit